MSHAVISDNRIGAGVFVRVVSPQAVERFWGGTSWLQMPNYLLGYWCPGEMVAKNVPRVCESHWNITEFKMKIQSLRTGLTNVSFHGQSSAVLLFHSAWGGNRKRKQPFISNLIWFLVWTIQVFWSVHIWKPNIFLQVEFTIDQTWSYLVAGFFDNIANYVLKCWFIGVARIRCLSVQEMRSWDNCVPVHNQKIFVSSIWGNTGLIAEGESIF